MSINWYNFPTLHHLNQYFPSWPLQYSRDGFSTKEIKDWFSEDLNPEEQIVNLSSLLRTKTRSQTVFKTSMFPESPCKNCNPFSRGSHSVFYWRRIAEFKNMPISWVQLLDFNFAVGGRVQVFEFLSSFTGILKQNYYFSTLSVISYLLYYY